MHFLTAVSYLHVNIWIRSEAIELDTSLDDTEISVVEIKEYFVCYVSFSQIFAFPNYPVVSAHSIDVLKRM